MIFRKTKPLFIALVLVSPSLWAPHPAHAGFVSPDLQFRVESAHPEEEISVIVHFARQTDLGSIRGTDKTQRRVEIVKALMDEADRAQGPLTVHLQSRGVKRIKSLWIINGVAAIVPAAMIDELSSFPGVERITPDYQVQVPPVARANAVAPEWNISAIHAPNLWNLGITGAGAVVANLDTGVDINHADLQAKWRGGSNSWYNLYSLPANSADCSTPDNCSLCELNSAAPCDQFGHGTGTMGIMVGGSAGGTAIGVAPGANWIAVKVLNDAGSGTTSIIHEGFQWILNPDGNSATHDAPNVVNASWGLDNFAGSCNVSFKPDIDALKAAGIAIVFAAGNSGPGASTSESPANNVGSFAAGATDISNTIASFSGRGPSACDNRIYPDVVAPGDAVTTAYLTSGGLFPNSYASGSGTSFAAPHVAGAMALLLSAFPNLSVPNLELTLKQSAADLGSPGADNTYGYGLVNVLGAYNLYAAASAVISALPSSYGFGFAAVGTSSAVQTFIVTNKGVGPNLSISSVSITGTDAAQFVKQSDSCSGQTLAPLATCTVGVTFSPTSTGSKSGNLSISSNDPATPVLNIPLTGSNLMAKIGIYRSGAWYLDNNGSQAWDGCGADTCYSSFGLPTDIPVTGDWDGAGRTKIGIFRDGQWFLDLNGNGAWDGCGTDACYDSFGLATDIPVTGDWDGTGRTKVGVFRDGQWFLDLNGNGVWEGCGTGACFASFGLATDIPVTGDWDGTGRTKVGVFRDGQWFLDLNGNGAWDGCGTDACFASFGLATDIPVTGDWDGTGRTKVGVFRDGQWFLDLNGNGVWDGCGTDGCYASFGMAADNPVTGAW